MTTTHGVGMTTRDGRFEVVSCEWDSNGSYRVTVDGPWPRTATTERKARDLARRVDPMHRVQWTRLDDVTFCGTDDTGAAHLHYSFTVSRLDPMHK